MSKKHKRKQHSQQVAQDVERNQRQEDFVNLYQADAGEDAIDMTTLEQTSGRKPLIAIAVIMVIALSAVAATLGYIVFGSHQLSVSPGDVTIAITGVDSVASGDQVTLQLHYVNRSPTQIDRGRVELLAPSGFYITSSDPAADTDDKRYWDISAIPAGAEGTITVTGQLVGQKDDQKDFTSLLTYTPVNFNSDFQASSHKIITLTDSALGLDVNVADTARTGEELQYVFTVQNNATLPLVNAKAVMTFPTGFDPKSAEPAATQSNQTWIFPEINPGDSQVVKIKGIVTAENNEDLDFLLQAGLQEPNDQFTVEAEHDHTVHVTNPELELSITATTVAQPGEKLPYTITVSNPSEVDLKDIVLTMSFTDNAVNSNEVTLDTIKQLKAGDSKEIAYTAVVNNPLPSDLSTIHAVVSVASAVATGAETDTDLSFDTTAEVDAAVQGSLSVSAVGRYYDDDLTKLGSGPVPPTVGQTTTYVMRWTVSASGDDMTDVTIQATVPDGVTYVRSKDERLSYDSTTRTVTLTIKALSRDDEKTADFTVSITPTAAQVNKLAVLMNEAIATGTDKNSGIAVQAQAKKITTKLTDDPAVTDDGVVIQ